MPAMSNNPMGLLGLLPRELRDQVWKYILVSPTAFLAPVSRHEAYHHGIPGSTSSKGPHHYLFVVDPDEVAGRAILPIGKTGSIALSLLRTCRQVYEETSSLFWESNSFIFLDPHMLLCTFKTMGPIASRHIKHVQLHLPIDRNAGEILKKVFELLGGQDSSSKLETLDLRLKWWQYGGLMVLRGASVGVPLLPRWIWNHWYNDLKSVLAMSSNMCKFRRRVLVDSPSTVFPKGPSRLEYWETEAAMMEVVLLGLSCAWKGDVLLNGNALIQNGGIVGKTVWQRILPEMGKSSLPMALEGKGIKTC